MESNWVLQWRRPSKAMASGATVRGYAMRLLKNQQEKNPRPRKRKPPALANSIQPTKAI